jgi:hypothetical protein
LSTGVSSPSIYLTLNVVIVELTSFAGNFNLSSAAAALFLQHRPCLLVFASLTLTTTTTSPLSVSPSLSRLNGMAGLSSMLDLGSLNVQLLVLCVWSLTPICWIYASLTLLSYIVELPTLPLLPLPEWWRSQVLHPVYLTWSVIEVLFSIYYAYLARKVQQRGPAPMYGRRFLRMVFSRALESNMDIDSDLSQDVAGSNTAGYDLRRRKNLTGQGKTNGRPSPSPLATKRLRAASYLPRFVVQEPLDREDPRAKKFAEVCPPREPQRSLDE